MVATAGGFGDPKPKPSDAVAITTSSGSTDNEVFGPNGSVVSTPLNANIAYAGPSAPVVPVSRLAEVSPTPTNLYAQKLSGREVFDIASGNSVPLNEVENPSVVLLI